MHAQVQIFCSERGGGGSKPNGEKTALIFFMFVFGFFSPKFSGDAGGVQLFTGGGGVQMRIPIEFDWTCDLLGMGVRTPYPPPPSGSAHA